MKILGIPYFVEFFFVLSTIVFVVTLYAILPALIYNKKTLFKPTLINSLWQRVYRSFTGSFEKVSRLYKKKEFEKAFLIVKNDFDPYKNK